ncbi:pitrilysin family protein, partial [Salinisphaera sp.]|uniref:M16 family metallopeptidase n=1 Tax=Salinisphaera sp. TaxID=1914330 RepID=UPI002D786B82
MFKHVLPIAAAAVVAVGVQTAWADTSSTGDTQPSKAAAGASRNDQVVRETLKNGLQVIVVPDRLAPVATTMLTYQVGSREAPKGFPGMAHAQEHMMFRGTKTLSAEQIAALGAALGGHSNAFTTNDSTTYYYTVPSQFTEVALRLQSERMQSVLDKPADWKQERGAIEQEVSQDMSSPLQVAIKRMRKTLYKGTPYAHDALGTRESFEQTTAKMLQTFHNRWYAPNNAVLVVAGDVDADNILAAVEDMFGGIPSQELPERRPVDPGKVDSKTIRMPTDSGYGFALIGSRAPGSRDVQAMATTEVLASVLNNPR